jgi:polyhydroxyalkanoate synthase
MANALGPLIPLAKATLGLYGDLAKAMLGMAKHELSPKDPRFADPAWRDNPFYQRLGQSYMAFCETIDGLAEANPDWRKRERAKFLGNVLTSTLAPTNTLLGSPAALKRAYETGGASLIAGTKGLPTQVNADAFKVGENLAATPGAVVLRTDMVELIQYQPMTAKVTERPTLMIVPPIGKYYFMDLAPKRSFIEYAVSRGIPMFVTSWRNPTAEHGAWGLDDYVHACLDVVDAVCDITGVDSLNLIGMCAGGILSTLMLNVMAARGDKRVHAATFGVMLLDFGTESPIGAFNVPRVFAKGRERSASKGVLPASDLATVFAWMRPNDLVWNYWSNNYLMGKAPPSFDILAWSVDGTNLPARLHCQFLEIFANNPLPQRGALRVLGEPVDLSQIRIETLVTGALTDHLTPWKACYRATQLLGGPSTFVLSNSGHIASLVNPPGNPKSTYWLGPKPGPNPDEWLAKAEKHTGTWWDVWAEWSLKRSGPMRPASTGPGSRKYPALAAAPGEYVPQKA